jgi:acyl-CoA thioesterase
MGTPFGDLTAVTRLQGAPDGTARYAAHIDGSWVLRPMPQGGVTTAIALAAMTAELDHPEQQLRTMHTMFTAQVPHGDVEVDVEVLRRGRTMSHVRAEVRPPGADRGHVVTAAFGADRAGFELTDVSPPPDVPLPHDCRSFREPPPGDWEPAFEPMPFWARRMEGRSAIGNPPWADYEPGRAERANWYRFDEPPWRDDGTLHPFAFPMLVDTMPGAVAEKLGPDQPPWFAPSVDLTLHVLDDCRSEWVLAHNTARHAGGGYASADMTLWDYGPAFDDPRPVAYATQVFLFSMG